MKRPPLSVILLAATALLSPLIGGMLANENQRMEPGMASLVRNLYEGMGTATLQHALLGLLISIGLTSQLARKKIMQVPQSYVAGAAFLFGGMLLGSVLVSQFKDESQVGLCEWLTYLMAFFLAVAGSGRKTGPKIIMAALVVGCVLVALVGLYEYKEAKLAGNPSWRIFGGWNNPNALAGILVVGLVLSLCLAVLEKGRTTGMCILAALLNGIALFLTQSKGGFGAAAIGLVTLGALIAGWTPKTAKTGLMRVGGTALALLILSFLILQTGKAASGGGVGSRLVDVSEAQGQSLGFRFLLWKGAAQLIKENPVGYGIGTYENYSAKSGMVTRTVLAHNTYLQLAVEASVVALIAFLALVWLWLTHTFRNSKSLPPEQNVLRAGIVAAVVATLAHGLLDSNLYTFGMGLVFFILLGLGLQLSADAVAPEFVPKPARWCVMLASAAVSLALLYAGYIGVQQSLVRYYIAVNDAASAKELNDSMKSLAPYSGETWYRAALLTSDFAEQLGYARKAVSAAPTPRNYRLLARDLEHAGDAAGAEAALKESLKTDPSNFIVLRQLMELQDKAGLKTEAMATARRLIATEETPLFKVRSLPQIIPTETYEARLYIAAKTLDRAQKLQLLKEAVEGLVKFATVTVPYLKQLQTGDPTAAPIGLPPEQIAQILTEATKAAQALKAESRDEVQRRFADDALIKFREAEAPAAEGGAAPNTLGRAAQATPPMEWAQEPEALDNVGRPS